MSLISQLHPIEISYDKQREIVIDNIAKMLIERGVVSNKNVNALTNTITSSMKNGDTCTITIDKPYQNDSKVYHIILLLDQKITNASKSSVIGEYIYKSMTEHKIIVVGDVLQKTKQSVHTSFPLVEIFMKKELMFNLVESIYVPKHILLSHEDAEKVLDEYGLQKKDLPRIFISDPVARYYKASLGQVFRIVRPSETSGTSNYYRIVVKDMAVGKSKK